MEIRTRLDERLYFQALLYLWGVDWCITSSHWTAPWNLMIFRSAFMLGRWRTFLAPFCSVDWGRWICVEHMEMWAARQERLNSDNTFATTTQKKHHHHRHQLASYPKILTSLPATLLIYWLQKELTLSTISNKAAQNPWVSLRCAGLMWSPFLYLDESEIWVVIWCMTRS